MSYFQNIKRVVITAFCLLLFASTTKAAEALPEPGPINSLQEASCVTPTIREYARARNITIQECQRFPYFIERIGLQVYLVDTRVLGTDKGVIIYNRRDVPRYNKWELESFSFSNLTAQGIIASHGPAWDKWRFMGSVFVPFYSDFYRSSVVVLASKWPLKIKGDNKFRNVIVFDRFGNPLSPGLTSFYEGALRRYSASDPRALGYVWDLVRVKGKPGFVVVSPDRVDYIEYHGYYRPGAFRTVLRLPSALSRQGFFTTAWMGYGFWDWLVGGMNEALVVRVRPGQVRYFNVADILFRGNEARKNLVCGLDEMKIVLGSRESKCRYFYAKNFERFGVNTIRVYVSNLWDKRLKGVYETRDGGNTWSPVVPVPFPQPPSGVTPPGGDTEERGGIFIGTPVCEFPNKRWGVFKIRVRKPAPSYILVVKGKRYAVYNQRGRDINVWIPSLSLPKGWGNIYFEAWDKGKKVGVSQMGSCYIP